MPSVNDTTSGPACGDASAPTFERRLLGSIAAALMIALLIGLALVWWGVNSLPKAERFGPGPEAYDAPSIFLLLTAGLAVVFIVVGRIARRGRPARMGWLGILSVVSLGAVITVVASLAAGLLWPPWTPQARWEPSIIRDRTAFVKARSHAYDGLMNVGNSGEYVVRWSWNVDEYGLHPDDPELHAQGIRWLLAWEEYGLPMRCFRSRYHFGQPRPSIAEVTDRFPMIMRELRIVPAPFLLNVAVWSLAIFIAWRGPSWARWLRRAGSGKCMGCGHQLTLDQTVCPECGRLVRPVDRLFVRRTEIG